MDAPAPTARLPPRYELLEFVGAGGMGVVHRARDRELDRVVAVKFLAAPASSKTAGRRFQREVAALARLRHPNVVRIYDHAETPDGGWYTMELLEGFTFAQLVEAGPVAPAKAVELVAQAADGLAAVHEAGLVHRDVKPQNLMSCADGMVRLMDFGLVASLDRAAVTRLTATGNALGTPGYQAPEVLAGGDPDATSDVFGLGVVLYELLTGQRAFTIVEVATWSAGGSCAPLTPPSRLVPGIPGSLDRLVLAATSAERAGRPTSATAFRDALRATTAEVPRRPSTPAAAPPAARHPRRALALLAAALAALGGFALVRRPPEELRDLGVRARGARSALLTWRGSQPSRDVLFRVGDATALAPAAEVELDERADAGGLYGHRALLRGLPAGSVELRVVGAQGTSPLPCTAEQAPASGFAWEARAALGADGGVEVALRSRVPFRATAPKPALVRADVLGLGYGTSATLSCSREQAAWKSTVPLVLESLDGERVTTALDLAELVCDDLRSVARAFAADRRNGRFYRGGGRSATWLGDLVRGATLRQRGAPRTEAPDLDFWRDVERELDAAHPWYVQLERLLPGLASWGADPVLARQLACTAPLALAPLRLLEGGGLLCRARDNPRWAAVLGLRLLSPPARPAPAVAEPALVVAFAFDYLPDSPRLVVDPHHPGSKRLLPPASLGILQLQHAVVDLGPGDPRGAAGAELEITSRKAYPGVLLLADLNGGACVLPLPPLPENSLRYESKATEGDAILSGVDFMFRQPVELPPGDERAVREAVRRFEEVMPRGTFTSYVDVPPSCLRPGRNELSLSAVVAPLQAATLALVTSLRLRVAR